MQIIGRLLCLTTNNNSADVYRTSVTGGHTDTIRETPILTVGVVAGFHGPALQEHGLGEHLCRSTVWLRDS